MSGFMGIVSLNQSPCDAALLQKMATSLLGRGDLFGYWKEGVVGLAQAEWEERKTTSLPYQTALSVVAADIRLDYVPDLLARLRACDVELESPHDVEMLVHAYNIWGEECVHYLEGDYAFILWDRRHKRLFGARSVTGLRPFVYRLTDSRFACASEAKQLLIDPQCSNQFNDCWMASFLTTGHDVWYHTPYKDIEKLPAGHLLLVDEQGIQVRQFESPASRRPPVLHTHDAVEQFHILLVESIWSRLQTSTPSFIDISGGLDSSTLASIAGIYSRQGRDMPPLCGLHAYAPHSKENNDSALAKQVAATGEIPLFAFSYQSCAPFDALFKDRGWSDTPSPSTIFFASLYDRIVSLAQELGVRAYLRGDFGDQLFDCSPRRYLRQLLEDHHYLWFLQHCWRWYQSGTMTVTQLLTTSFRPTFSPPLEQRVPWLKMAVLDRARIIHQDTETLLRQQIHDPLQRQLTRAMLLHDDYLAQQSDRLLAAGLETREPYMDDRLITFLMRCPPQEQLRPGEKKYLLREVMKDILPEAIRLRRSKGRIARLLFSGIAKHHLELRELILTMPAELEPYIDAKCLIQALNEAAQGSALDQTTFFSALALIIWAHRLPWCHGWLPRQEAHILSQKGGERDGRRDI